MKISRCTVLWASLAGLAGLPGQALAQVYLGTLYNTGQNTPVCISSTSGAIFLPDDDDCNPGLVGHDPFPTNGIYVGTPDNYTWTKDNGDLEVNAAASFQKDAVFNGTATFNTAITADSVTAQAITSNGVVRGEQAQFTGLQVSGYTVISGFLNAYAGLQSRGSLSVTAGSTVSMGGNAIHDVGAPTSATDAANKGYVDTAVNSVQSGLTSLTATVDTHTTQIAALQETDTRLTSTVDSHTAQIASINATDALQSSQISTLQSQVGTLQNDVAGIRRDIVGLRQDIRRANAGIAAAVAIGGTMVVPDSAVTLSFNLATYRGEQGFSGILVGRVAPRIYANVGVAGSTAKGSTTGRVGIAFGL